jgi:hypothetical protein
MTNTEKVESWKTRHPDRARQGLRNRFHEEWLEYTMQNGPIPLSQYIRLRRILGVPSYD